MDYKYLTVPTIYLSNEVRQNKFVQIFDLIRKLLAHTRLVRDYIHTHRYSSKDTVLERTTYIRNTIPPNPQFCSDRNIYSGQMIACTCVLQKACRMDAYNSYLPPV